MNSVSYISRVPKHTEQKTKSQRIEENKDEIVNSSQETTAGKIKFFDWLHVCRKNASFNFFCRWL